MSDIVINNLEYPSVSKKRPRKYADVRLSEEEVVDELRSFFLRQIEISTPEVLQTLHDHVLPEYVKARGAVADAAIFPYQKWPESLRSNISRWSAYVHLLHKGKPPHWIIKQIEFTLNSWVQYPARLSKGLTWGAVGGYSASASPPEALFLIELPTYRWDWKYGFETSESLKKWILEEVTQIVDARIAEMEQELDRLPRVINKLRHRHVKWAVLHQIRRVKFKELARLEEVSETTVRNEVTAFKERIGISLPKGRRRNSTD